MDFDPQARPIALSAMEHDHVQYVVRPKGHVRPEHLLRNEFWEHVSQRLRVDDVVNVYATDASFYMRMWLISKRTNDAGYAHLQWRVIEKVVFEDKDAGPEPEDDGLRVKRGPPTKGFRIINEKLPEQPIIAEGFRTIADAEEELANIRAERAAA